jgi:hypothetical protein
MRQTTAPLTASAPIVGGRGAERRLRSPRNGSSGTRGSYLSDKKRGVVEAGRGRYRSKDRRVPASPSEAGNRMMRHIPI